MNSILEKFNIRMLGPDSTFDIILPVGISFYTFQAIGYIVDVYRGEIKAERNFFKYALFVSFFPQLVAGPIERSKNLLCQIDNPQKFNFERMREGLLITLWGYFLKIVIADRIAIFVDIVYDNYILYEGVYLIVASLLFAVQIYCDFAGYSIIAMGVAKILGFQLMENFNAPYLAQSVSDFWRRWHISLSSWFRDYVYVPMGGSRKGKQRKYANLFIVFIISGLWHGASWNFVAWGGINGIFQIIGDLLKPIREKINLFFKMNETLLGHKIAKMLVTFVLVDFTWIFFRAESIYDAIQMIKSIITVHNWEVLFDQSLYTVGLEQRSFYIMEFSIIILILMDIAKYKGIKVREIIIKQELWCRWFCYLCAIMFILVFGIWGTDYDAAGFIYFQF